MPNILDEYLIRLGATIDQSGMRKFEQALRDATNTVDKTAGAMTGAFFKAQAEIVGGFAAIGGATIGLADKVAMADQEYRLFALHMYMSKDAARALKVAMDALGQPLENLAWDAELRGRTHQLIADQRNMAPGADFDANMKKIRDIRFEFTRMEVELQYVTMHVVNDFMKALGLGPDTLLEKLQRFNDWVTHNVPEIAEQITNWFMPVWHDVEDVMGTVEHTFKDTAVAFMNLVGVLTGDKSLEGTTLSMDKLSKATHGAVDLFAQFAETITNLEDLLAHLLSAVTLMAAGKFKEAGSEFKAALNDVNAKLLTGAIGGVVGGMIGHPIIGAGIGTSVGDKIDTLIGIGTPREWVERMAKKYNVDPELAHALAQTESSEQQYDSKGNVLTSHDKLTGHPIAQGVMQLTAGTAKALGVDREDMGQNVAGGVALLSRLLKEYGGDVPTAIGAYHEGEPKMNRILAGQATLSPEARDEIASVMQRMGKTGDVHIGSIVIHIPEKNATNAGVGKAVVDALNGAQEKRTQRNLTEFQDLSWSY